MFSVLCFVSLQIIGLSGGLNIINNVNYVYPLGLNFNVNHQSNDVVSTSRGRSTRMRWTKELQAMFIAIVDKFGGPWAVKPRHILREMEHMGITIHQIKNHLQAYRAKLDPNDVRRRRRRSKASLEKKLVQDVQEQSKNVDEWKANDDVYFTQPPIKEEMMGDDDVYFRLPLIKMEMMEADVPPMIDNVFMKKFP